MKAWGSSIRGNLLAPLSVCAFVSGMVSCTENRPSEGSPNVPSFVQEAGSEEVSTACASTEQEAQPVALRLVFLLDRSFSMKDNGKIDALKKVLVGFVGKASPDLQVALQVFPSSSDPNRPESYTKPLVEMGPLQDKDPLLKAIQAIQPNGDTPTAAAVSGVVQYVDTLRAKDPYAPFSIVLVTDGAPCNPGQAPDDGAKDQAVAAIAASAQQKDTPVYVIGLGPGVFQTQSELYFESALNEMARAGGTPNLFLVSATGDTAGVLAKAFAEIKVSNLSKVYPIPDTAKKSGLFNPETTTVLLTCSGKTTPLVLTPDNPTGEGWRLDDPSDPKAVVLNDQTFKRLRFDLSAKISIGFGCTPSIR